MKNYADQCLSRRMKVCVVLAALAVVVFSGPVSQEIATGDDDDTAMDYFLVETSPGVFEIEDLTDSEIDVAASEADLTYHFFSKHDPTKGTDLKITNIDVLKKTEFKASKETVFVIHGWKSDNESTYNTQMREAVLPKHDINVFVVDWSPTAGKSYISARASVLKIGTYLASFIQSLSSTYGLKLSQVTLIGHSLGAHIAGNAGAALGGQVARIVGLDPAGPLFFRSNINDRLDPTDAKFVQVIHTNSGLLGFSHSSGHADYYPNGGSSQPGCILDIAGACAHARSFMYYAESILNGGNDFVSTQCSSYLRFNLGLCTSNAVSLMAGYTVDTRANGDFYLKTNSKSPFALG